MVSQASALKKEAMDDKKKYQINAIWHYVAHSP